jgi:RNA polymerase sigma-70 factor (ECF subfamily)
MNSDLCFAELLRRVRQGDEQAAADLVRLYLPALQRLARVRLRSLQLQRLYDADDLCQSVLLAFFPRVLAGRYQLDSATDLLRLLSTMLRNKLLSHVESQQAGRRDRRRLANDPVEERQLAAPGETPSQAVANRELLVETRRRLSDDERELLELREQGHDWAAIARALGGSPEALRKKLCRALARVRATLGVASVASV